MKEHFLRQAEYLVISAWLLKKAVLCNIPDKICPTELSL